MAGVGQSDDIRPSVELSTDSWLLAYGGEGQFRGLGAPMTMTVDAVDADVLSGSQLIFLISQPRAGSTLLQRILACHPDVHTASEPWLMLHLAYAVKPSGITAEYDAPLAREAVHRFVAGLPGGEETYYQAVRSMASSLYGAALAGTAKRHFLDKTPRYYLIINELARLFPRAQFIFLFRNPLAVLASMLDLWIQPGSGLPVSSMRNDVSRAPDLLVAGVASLGARAIVVHYERLVQEPDAQVPALCRKLGLDVVPGMAEYGRYPLPRWELGDGENVYKQGKPIAAYAERWLHRVREPQRWRLSSDYLQFLGRDTIAGLGYDYGELRRMLDAEQPARWRLVQTYPLHWWLGAKPAQLVCARGLVRFQAEGITAFTRPIARVVARVFDRLIGSNRLVRRLTQLTRRVAVRCHALSARPASSETKADRRHEHVPTGRESEDATP